MSPSKTSRAASCAFPSILHSRWQKPLPDFASQFYGRNLAYQDSLSDGSHSTVSSLGAVRKYFFRINILLQLSTFLKFHENFYSNLVMYYVGISTILSTSLYQRPLHSDLRSHKLNSSERSHKPNSSEHEKLRPRIHIFGGMSSILAK